MKVTQYTIEAKEYIDLLEYKLVNLKALAESDTEWSYTQQIEEIQDKLSKIYAEVY